MPAYFYICSLKKIITLFLFIIICVSHLNIIDALIDVNTRYKKEKNALFKNLPSGEENDTEKENEGKSKEEKIFTNIFGSLEGPHFLNKNNFNSYRLPLNIDPYQDDDIQPPKAV